jgi:DNA-binding PadR family transcriptional regulator
VGCDRVGRSYQKTPGAGIPATFPRRPPSKQALAIGKLIESRSGGTLTYNVASLYPLLYRLEKRGWIKGQWIEKPGQRRRRYYRLTSAGRRVLDAQRSGWKAFVAAINRITGLENA